MTKRLAGVFCAVLLLSALLPVLPCGARAETVITSKDQLNRPGMKVGVSTGSASALIVEKELPNAQIVYFEENATAYEAVAQGKIDAYVFDRVQMQLAINSGRSGVHLLDENMDETVQVAIGISPRSAIPDFQEKLGTFITEIRQDGTLAEMYSRWTEQGDTAMPDIQLPENPKYHLTVGTAGIVPPYSYYVGKTLNGFDIEMANRFAAWLDASLEFKVYDFGAIVPAAITGDVDCIMSNLNVTEERKEAIAFSEVIYENIIGIMVRGDAQDDGARGAAAVISVDQLNGKVIGSATGTTYDEIVKRRLPDVTFSYFNTYSDMVAALKAGKIAAFACDEPVLKGIMAQDSRVAMLPEYLDTFEYGFIFGKDEDGEALCDQMSEFIRGIKDDGTLSQLTDQWLGGHMDAAEMSDIGALGGENGTLTLAIDAMNPPFEYMRGGAYAGFEVELAIRFCEKNGYALDIRNMDFDAILTSVQTGKADFGASTISITEERKQNVAFCEPYYSGGTVLAVLGGGSDAAAPAGRYTSFTELKDKRIGVTTGSVQAIVIQDLFPNATISYFSSTVDMLNALRAQKIDAFAESEPLISYILPQNPDLICLNERLGSVMQAGTIFPKTEEGQALCDAFNEYLQEIQQNGDYDALKENWFGADGSKRSAPDLNSLPATKGTLKVAVDPTVIPFAFIENGKPAGFDIDIAFRFCREKGYGLKVVQTDFAGIIPAVVSGKVDFATGGIAYTPERAQSVLYSEPTYEGSSVMVVLKAEGGAKAEAGPSFRDRVSASFTKTFVREDRWQLFLKGIVTTLVITVATIFFGTALGFALFMLCRNGNAVANAITRFSFWLVQGMPMVVLLMMLYYVIFGSIAINGIVVAVFGFTLTFGASVFGLLKMGVGAVDVGQYEAAYALGYSNRRTFFRIILPQALPHVLPAYKGEIVGLIKATAVVGYIAVQDLTKMGDIVRSRTYEAFFPLIAVTVIYFVLEGIIRRVISLIMKHMNPKRRKPKDILKGVKIDDQD